MLLFLFQSAHPRGMRYASLGSSPCFNPRDFDEPRSKHPCLPT